MVKTNRPVVGLIIGVEEHLSAPEAKYADRDVCYFTDFLIVTIELKKKKH